MAYVCIALNKEALREPPLSRRLALLAALLIGLWSPAQPLAAAPPAQEETPGLGQTDTALPQVSAEGLTTCVIGAAGALSCWGANTFGVSTVPADLGAAAPTGPLECSNFAAAQPAQTSRVFCVALPVLTQ